MVHLNLAYLPLVILLPVIISIIRALISPLRRIQGPFWARLTRLWLLQSVYKSDFPTRNIALHEKYGPVVRIAPNEYSVDDPEAVKTLYGHGTAFIKSPWYEASLPPNPPHDFAPLFTDRDPKRHAANRRKVANLYSMTNLLQMEPLVEKCIDIFNQKLASFGASGEAFDLQHWLQCYAFDVIALLTLDERFGFLDDGEDKGGLVSAIDKSLFYAANAGVYPEWHPFLFKVVSLAKGQTAFGFLRGFARRKIDERLSVAAEKNLDEGQRGDFLTKSLNLHAADPSKFTMADVLITCLSNIGAGSDTTSISLTSILYQLILNPKCLHKLRQELDEAAAHGSISSPITFAESQKLPYLQACLKEGLRMHPATGLIIGRVVPKGGAVISGHDMPEGTIVGINAWVASNNKTVFGADVSHFVPERWLGDAQQVAAMERYLLVFGHGSRTCIGKNISLMEIGKLVPELVRRFDFSLVHPEKRLETHNVWFVKQMNLLCRVALRDQGEKNL